MFCKCLPKVTNKMYKITNSASGTMKDTFATITGENGVMIIVFVSLAIACLCGILGCALLARHRFKRQGYERNKNQLEIASRTPSGNATGTSQRDGITVNIGNTNEYFE